MVKNNYKQLIDMKRNANDIVALYRGDSEDELEYVIFTLGSSESIKFFLPTCDGKALRIAIGKQPLWMLLDGDSEKKLFFRAVNGIKQYDDIHEEDLSIVKYICNL